MNVRRACALLELAPDELADIFRREVSHECQGIAEVALRGGTAGMAHGVDRLRKLLLLINALEVEWERQQSGDGGGGALKEATLESPAAGEDPSGSA